MNLNKEFINLIKENPNLNIYAYVNGEVCQDDCMYWLGEFNHAEIREYAKVETYGWNDMDIVYKDEPEEYIEHLLTRNEDMTDDDAERIVKHLNYKKAIFVYIDLPKTI